MANKTLWDAAFTSRAAPLLSTGLNALASAAASAAVSFDNSTNLEQYFWAEFVSGGSWTPAAGAFLEIYAVPALDGTNYGTANQQPSQLVAIIDLPNSAGTHRAPSRCFMLGPGKYNVSLKNSSGSTLPATGNVLNLFAASDELQ